MDGFMKNLSSPTPTKSSAIPRISQYGLQQRTCSSKVAGEVDENQQDFHHQMGSNSQNLKKSATKHFMSPTVSAASKVSVLRKKILADRNEDSGSVISEDLGFDTNSSQITPVSSRISEPDKSYSDLGSQPYDPLTNYLSPRPKFLRYNPNRRVEIFLRREKELQKWADGSADTECATLEQKKMVEEEELGLSSRERSIKLEDGSSLSVDKGSNPCKSEENDEKENEDYEGEPEEEEQHWHLNEVLKYLLLLGVLLLSTLYISSMNSPTSPPSLWDLKEGYQKIQDHVCQTVMNNSVVGSVFFNKKQEKDQNFVEETERIVNERFGKQEMVKQETEKRGKISDQMGEILGQHEGEITEISDALQVSQTQFVPDWMNYTDLVHENPSIFETKVNSDQDELAEVLEVETTYYDDERAEVLESKPSSNDEQIPNEKVSNEEIEEEMVKNEVEEAVDATDGMVEMIEQLGRENAEIFESLEVPQIQFMYDKNGDQNIISDIPIPSEPEAKSDKLHDEPKRAESISKRTMGISLLSVIAVSTVLGFRYLKHRKPSANSSPTTEPSFESMVVEERSSRFHDKVERVEEKIEKADSYVSPLSSVHSQEKGTKELNQSRAPTVELLGEYMVEDFSSSLKSFSLNSKPRAGEESNFSQSREMRMKRTMGISTSNQNNPSVTGFSAMESSSYGRFTAQEKIVRKEESKYGEGSMKEITTPVRRSSRIRNRAVMSP